MRTLVIVGSGPAGFYTAEAALKTFGDGVRIDMLDALPTPFGLIRAGVAPDHQSIKAVARRFAEVAEDPRVRFLGDVAVGRDIAVAELQELYHDVVLATGAPEDRCLGIPGEDLPGVIGSAAFVGWYNGHPAWADLKPPLDSAVVAIIGNGNVAIDCARILAKTEAELAPSDIAAHALDALRGSAVRSIRIVGRRGPHEASFTLKEVGELGELARATPLVRPGDLPPEAADAGLETGRRRVVGVLRRFAAQGPDSDKPVVIAFDFFRRPLRVLGDGRVAGLELMRTRVGPDGRAEDTGETEILPCGLVITAIGYRTAGIPGVPFDEALGRFSNEEGAIAPGLWCVGWARRGPTGTIGTNRQDGFGLVERLAATAARGERPGPAGLDRLLAGRGIRPVSFADWRRIEAVEAARARAGAPREKLVTLEALRAAARAEAAAAA